jgi:Carbohydrate-selective porin, OprB family
LDVSSSLSARTFLFLNTSFTGKDLLQILLAAGNVNRLDRFVTGTDMTAYNSTVTVNTQNNLILGSIFYQFPVGDKLTAFISPGTSVSVDFFNSIIPTRSISAFGERNPIFKMFEFTGGGSLLYKPSEALSLQVGYGNYTFRISNPADGLFGDDGSTYGAVLTVKPSQSSNLVFSYIHYYSSQLGPVLNATGGTGSLLAQAPFGESTATEVNAFGLEASYRLSKRFSIGGWVGYEKARADASVNAEGLDVSKGDRADIWNWAVTMAFPDFGKKGSQLNFIFGTPPWVAKNDVNGRADRNRSYHIEASYNYPLSQNIVITPGLAVILNPEHNSNNDPLWLGTLKTTLFL